MSSLNGANVLIIHHSSIITGQCDLLLVLKHILVMLTNILQLDDIIGQSLVIY